MLKFLVLQHFEWETPGRLLLDAARELNIFLEIIKIYEKAAPDPADYDALILLGGSPRVHEEDRYAFLREEKRLIRAWMTIDKPCLGFSLGHQLLAEALGAEIDKNFLPSLGFLQGHLTHAGKEHPLFKDINSPLTLFKKNSQSIQTPLPKGFLMLATSSQCVIEAFSIEGRPHIIGFQCDNHAAHHDDIKSWLRHNKKWIANLPEGKYLMKELPKLAKQQLAGTQSIFLQIMNNFVTLVQVWKKKNNQ